MRHSAMRTKLPCRKAPVSSTSSYVQAHCFRSVMVQVGKAGTSCHPSAYCGPREEVAGFHSLADVGQMGDTNPAQGLQFACYQHMVHMTLSDADGSGCLLAGTACQSQWTCGHIARLCITFDQMYRMDAGPHAYRLWETHCSATN